MAVYLAICRLVWLAGTIDTDLLTCGIIVWIKARTAPESHSFKINRLSLPAGLDRDCIPTPVEIPTPGSRDPPGRTQLCAIVVKMENSKSQGSIPGNTTNKKTESSEPIDEHLVGRVSRYIEDLLVPADSMLTGTLLATEEAGLPAIQVSPLQGKLLYLIAKMSGVKRVLEIGTLGGYSTIWLARALPGGGRLITLELDPKHAAVASGNVGAAGLGALVEIRIGRAADSLRQMIDRGEPPFDLIFIDADKSGYPEYLDLSLLLSRSGTVILADNVIRHGAVINPSPANESSRGVSAFNEAIASNAKLESIILPIFRQELDGLSLSRVR
jgi:caffeoyl-CoA O-methyltransferase